MTMRTTRTLSAAFAIAALAALAGCAGMQSPVAGGDTNSTTAASAPGSVPIPIATLLDDAQSQADDDAATARLAALAGAIGGPDANLWGVMRQKFSLPDGNETQVREQLSFFRGRSSFIQHSAQRAEPYLYYIVSQLEAHNMPVDLALLPIVESGFNPYAYSPGHAAGLWQFISSTGRIYGLKQDSWYDGRLDVVAATGAALKYLENLHDQFDGNWLLALAAYNSGSITVQQAIDYNRRHGLPTDFWHLNLPAQTRAYVPRLLAIRDIIANPGKFGVTLPFIANVPCLAEVDLKGQLDLAIAAKFAGMDLKDLYRINPGYSRWATPPDGPFTLLLPIDKKSQFLAALDAKTQLERAPGWISHRVRSGETLSGIAANYHTSVASLEEHNQLRGSVIRVGAALKVPTSGSGNNLRYVTDQPMQVAYDYSPPTPGRSSRSSGDEPSYSHIRVRSGDSLWGVAKTYHVSVADLARWNHLSTSARLRTGQTLAVLATASGASAPAGGHYVVRSGDSLSTIAARYHVSISDLANWNSIGSGSVIHPGQQLLIGGDGDKEAAVASTSYVVKSGDSLSAIASRFDVSTGDLAAWNSLSRTSVLHPGQTLEIHGAAAADVAANQARRIHYVVRSGDSLYAISNRFNVSVAKLTDWNSLSAASILHPGQLLTLFVSASN
ncbi:MAG TPA: LysM peptidoglycan-binding domain-containing protein [Gammaproteobacteria bacterium]|nr:LysM peptidoglycan-binding domain-containing protein [Gammaproteobacteria bacterium]